MGDFKKYIRAYLFAYGLMALVSLIMFGVPVVLEKLIDPHEDVIIVIGLLFYPCFWGVPLCYAFPEYKKETKSAPVRIIKLGLLGPLLPSFIYGVFYWVRETCLIINIGPSLFMIVLIVVSFPFFWVYKSSFYVWFAGEDIKFKKVLIDFGVTIVLSLLFFLAFKQVPEEKIERKNVWFFLCTCLIIFSLYSLIITDVVRGYFVRRGEVEESSEEKVVSIKEEEVIEKEEKAVVREPELPIVQSGSCGENVCYKLTADSTLTIFGQGPMCDYDYKNVSPFKDMEVRKVIIEKGVTKIGDMSFMGCSSLEDLVIADSVTEIGVWSFGYCENLRSLSIPKSVKIIRCRAFRCCNKSLVVNFAKKVKTIEDNAFDEEVFMGK